MTIRCQVGREGWKEGEENEVRGKMMILHSLLVDDVKALVA